jgi:hypothetical protein
MTAGPSDKQCQGTGRGVWRGPLRSREGAALDLKDRDVGDGIPPQDVRRHFLAVRQANPNLGFLRNVDRMLGGHDLIRSDRDPAG